MEKTQLDPSNYFNPPPYRRTPPPPPTPTSPRLLHNLPRTPRKFLQTLLISALLAFAILSHCGYIPTLGETLFGLPRSAAGDKVGVKDGSKTVKKVQLEAHMMSKCPDARDCLRDLVVPAMEKIADKVDFRMSYIGDVDPDDSITCKHGPTECLGNILSLCTADLYPTTSDNTNNTKISLGFTTCMITSYPKIPDRSLIENCALEHGVDFDKLNGCVSEEGKGLDLLKKSVLRSKQAGVTRSCTVRLDGKKRCLRDNGEWRDCESIRGKAEGSRVEQLVADVDMLFERVNRALEPAIEYEIPDY
ncbi:MAG: hypothetical protein MMC33_008166 [Icmadophila ericetorum]|nr:hypothetical protein [Icmadophila ericetorum]